VGVSEILSYQGNILARLSAALSASIIGAIFMKFGRAPAIRSIRFMFCLDRYAYTLNGALALFKGNSGDANMADL
jgi:hypothetical protein